MRKRLITTLVLGAGLALLVAGIATASTATVARRSFAEKAVGFRNTHAATKAPLVNNFISTGIDGNGV